MSNDTVAFESNVGPQLEQDGAGDLPLRKGRENELVTSAGHGDFYEQTMRGRVFSVATAIGGTTIVAANNAPPAAAAATALTVLNPLGSGVNLEIMRCVVGHVSGTPAAGAFRYCVAYQAASITASTNATAQPMYTSQKQSVTKCWTQTALTGGAAHTTMSSLPTTPFAAALAASSPVQAFDDVRGAIVVAPGWCITIASAGTGTSHVVEICLVWAENPSY